MAGINGFGTSFERGDGADPEVFTAIAEPTNISGPGITREALDVTSHQSPNAYMEFVGGLKDPGEVTVDVRYDPAEHDSLLADFEDPEPRNYRIVWPDPATTTWTFAAIMTGFEPEGPYDDALSASLTFKVTSKPTLS